MTRPVDFRIRPQLLTEHEQDRLVDAMDLLSAADRQVSHVLEVLTEGSAAARYLDQVLDAIRCGHEGLSAFPVQP